MIWPLPVMIYNVVISVDCDVICDGVKVTLLKMATKTSHVT